jgi:hypothetical protein
LRRLLADADTAAVELAIECLAKMETPRSLALLGGYAEGSLPGVAVRSEQALAAARGLLARGDAGVERACVALELLCRRARPADARRAWRLAALLRELDHPRTAAALERWRRSPARLVAALFRARAKWESRNAG